MRTLTRDEARAAYDRIGRAQDTQAFYEDRAVESMLSHADLGAAASVLEFGCGTGRLARRLLRDALSADTRYVGIDVSPKMVSLARRRLAEFGDRAVVRLSDGSPHIDVPAGSVDRFVSTYVFDLLSDDDMRAALESAHRALAADGLLCITCLTHARTVPERAVSAVLGCVHRMRPQLLGGCRPVALASGLSGARWQIVHAATIAAFFVRSEVVVARRVAHDA